MSDSWRGPRETACGRGAGSARGGAADGGADVGEGLVGVAAEGRDGGGGHHDDQGEHDRGLDGRRAVFRLQKSTYLVRERAHGAPLMWLPSECPPGRLRLYPLE